MADLSQLETCFRELSSAIQSFITHSHHVAFPVQSSGINPTRVTTPDSSNGACRARELALANLTRLQIMLFEPGDFLQQLALQTQLLACIQWLGEFQVPACIPMDGSALMKDVSDLIGVPETQLGRIVSVASLGGFLQEAKPGHVAHSPLSAAFVAKPSYLDAAMFLADKAAPAAWKMAAATKQVRDSPQKAQEVMFHEGIFANAEKSELPRLQRQWRAYLRYGLGHHCDTATDILTCLGTSQIGAGSLVVEVGARSTERVLELANKYPCYRLIAQMSSTASIPSSISSNGTPAPKLRHPRIQVQYRDPGTPQPIEDASIYIINFPLPEPGATWTSLMAELDSELRAHLSVLHKRPTATLVLTAPALPERGTIHADPGIESRLRDLSLMQLANEREHEMSEVIGLLNGMGNSEGRLVLVNKVRSRGRGGAVALEIKYQVYPDQ